MTSQITVVPPEHKHPILIQISLEWFFDRMVSGVHGFATTSKEFGDYIHNLDPEEAYTHVYYPPNNKANLAWIYPKHVWMEAVKHREELELRSEEERQTRFLRERRAAELAIKFKEREDELTRVTNLLYARFGTTSFVRNSTKKNLRMAVTLLLSGKGDKGACQKLGICQETIDNFLSLPQPLKDEESLLNLLIQESPTPTIVQ